jgi:hypothetical protein
MSRKHAPKKRLTLMNSFLAAWWLLVCPLSFVTATFLGFVTVGIGVMIHLLETNLRINCEILGELKRQRRIALEGAIVHPELEELMRA